MVVTSVCEHIGEGARVVRATSNRPAQDMQRRRMCGRVAEFASMACLVLESMVTVTC